MTLDEHEALNDWAYNKMKSSGKYDSVIKHFEYHEAFHDIELDVVAFREHYDNRRHHRMVAVYVETKSHYNKTSVRKSLSQFRKVQRLLPEYDWRFLRLTTEKGVERVRL